MIKKKRGEWGEGDIPYNSKFSISNFKLSNIIFFFGAPAIAGRRNWKFGAPTIVGCRNFPPFLPFSLIFYCFILFPACSQPSPPETKFIENIDFELHKIGAEKYIPVEYNKFRADLRILKDLIIQEESRFSLFRDYEPLLGNIRSIEKEGIELLDIIQKKRSDKREKIAENLKNLEDRARIIDELTLKIHAGAHARKKLTSGSLAIKEAKISLENNRYDSAEGKIETASVYLSDAEKALIPLLKRYSHNDMIERWKKSVRNTIEEARKRKTAAIIVNKAERMLTLYKDGKPLMTFDIGIGKNGYRDKLFSGDRATPEGRYKVIKKSGAGESKYHKALLLDYPNHEDRREFLKAQKTGLISKNAKIGGLIEIHGGGKDSTTYGCIALENHEIDALFEKAAVGTPVTIVGATSLENELSNGLVELKKNHDRKE
jgi:lipoprotein-anchoring transpeptidase ErfK/SrfK